MTREEAARILRINKPVIKRTSISARRYLEAFDMAISALSAQNEAMTEEELAEFKKELANAVPEREKGEWISEYDEDGKTGWYECSCCHSERAFNTNFCPDCGADMRGGNE